MTRDTFDLFHQPDRGRFGDNESVRGNDSVRSDLIDLTVALHYETPAHGVNPGAVLVSDDGTESRAVWIPKSRCEFQKLSSFITGRRKNGSSVGLPAITLTLSSWLAKEKGLV
jgi:hypothetical protein